MFRSRIDPSVKRLVKKVAAKDGRRTKKYESFCGATTDK